MQPPRVPNFLRLPIDGLTNNAHPLGQRHYLHPPATRLSALPTSPSMPPEPIALDSSDEDERRYPLRSDRRKPKREYESDSEVDELESDKDDDPQPCAAPPTRKSPVRSAKPKSARKLKKERNQAKKKKKKLQREAREAREARQENSAVAAESAHALRHDRRRRRHR